MNGPLTKHITWKEALLLPSWGVEHIPSEVEIANIKRTAEVLEKIRTACGNRPISVHCFIRPVLNRPGHSQHGKDYNKFKLGAAKSWHKIGLAVDFSVAGMSCDDVRVILSFKLKELGIRMEKNPGSNWVHIDLAPVSNDKYRYFSV